MFCCSLVVLDYGSLPYRGVIVRVFFDLWGKGNSGLRLGFLHCGFLRGWIGMSVTELLDLMMEFFV